jgi:hypothetical protein
MGRCQYSTSAAAEDVEGSVPRGKLPYCCTASILLYWPACVARQVQGLTMTGYLAAFSKEQVGIRVLNLSIIV